MEHDEASPTSAEIGRLATKLSGLIDRPIVLVGMMGVGKTTVGRKLAALLGLPFLDADDEIERAAQMSIPEIFAGFGEAYFRSGERRVIARLVGDSIGEGNAPVRSVLATGGGAFVDPDTRALILRRAIPVWLDSDVDTLVARVGRKGNRPLLRTGDPREILTRLKAERQSAYAEAPIHITSGNQPHQVTALAILKAIDAWL
jgi:shikimate kinase